MFIPGEHFLTAALEQDPNLWDYAFDRKVLLATPTNLIAIARTVAAVWRQEKLAKEARQIGELGKELYDRLAKAADDMRKVGSGLSSAVNNYNSFVSSFESAVAGYGAQVPRPQHRTGRARDRSARAGRGASALCATTRKSPFHGPTTTGRRRSPPNSRLKPAAAVEAAGRPPSPGPCRDRCGRSSRRCTAWTMFTLIRGVW